MSINQTTRSKPTKGSRKAHGTLSDETPIKAVTVGDRAAMHTFYKRHNVNIYRFIRRLVGDHHLTENLVGDVFLEVWQHADHFEGALESFNLVVVDVPFQGTFSATAAVQR
jgi:sigma-70-like protein